MLGGFNLSDIAVCAIIILFALWGYKRGLIKSIFGLGSIVISIVLALVLYQPVAGMIYNSPVGEYVSSYIDKTILESDAVDDNATADDAKENLALPGNFLDSLTDSLNEAKDNALSSASNGISNLVINIISMLAVFLIVKLIIWILTHLLDSISKIPVLGGINKLLGGAFGAMSGLLCVYILLALLALLAAVNPENAMVKSVIDSSFASGMYNENFIVNFLNIK